MSRQIDFSQSQDYSPAPAQPQLAPNLTSDQVLDIIYGWFQRWKYEWNTDPGHQKKLYEAVMGVDVLNHMVRDMWEEMYAGADNADFSEAYEAKQKELYPPPETSPSDFHAMINAMTESVFGETGLKNQFLDAIKASAVQIGTVADAQIDASEKLDQLRVQVTKLVEAKAPASDELGAAAAVVLKDAAAKAQDEEAASEVAEDMRKKLAVAKAEEAREQEELKILEDASGGKPKTLTEGTGRKGQ